MDILILSLLLCLVASSSLLAIRSYQPTQDPHTGTYLIPEDMQPKKETTKNKSQIAFNRIKHDLDRYKESKVGQSELQDLIEYLGYYRSWYQSVSPAPQELYQKLSRKSRQLVELIKKNAKQFEITRQQDDRTKPMMGSSRLTNNGHEYYQLTIDNLSGQESRSSILKPQIVY